MSAPRIALIHALELARRPVLDAFGELWPEAETVEIMDESLSRDLARAGALTPAFNGRMTALARRAVDGGADGILFTCSAFGAAIEVARAGLDIPVLKPEEAMIEDALAAGGRVGGLATFAPTIPSLVAEVEGAAARLGVEAEIDIRHVPGAMEALKAGRGDEHDRLIAAAAAALGDCAAVMLAQFSMARAQGAVAHAVAATVLSSPASAVTRLRRLLDA